MRSVHPVRRFRTGLDVFTHGGRLRVERIGGKRDAVQHRLDDWRHPPFVIALSLTAETACNVIAVER